MAEDKLVRVGSDECLKGDTFGGLVVAAAKAGPKEREKLIEIGVRDSKSLSDGKIMIYSRKITEILGEKNISVLEVFPEDYNKIKSVTALLNSMHARAARSLLPADEVVIDQYPGCSIAGAITETKAESKYVEVAAASIMARAQGLKQIEELTKLAGFKIPLGSTHVKSALLELKKRGLAPEKFVKLSFRNVKDFFG